MSNIGQFIKNKRTNAGLSQKALGTACGISDSTINNIEKGKTRSPNWILLCDIAKALKFHPFDIMKAAGYITEDEISPYHSLNGLDEFNEDEIKDVQSYIDYLLYRKYNRKS